MIAYRYLFVKETESKFIGEVKEAGNEAIFIDGSRYRGTWDSLGIAGAGIFRMPHEPRLPQNHHQNTIYNKYSEYNVIFEGEIRDGMSHGQGTLEYPGKQRIDGVWNRGELRDRRYTFSDGFVYRKEGWSYCRFPDRRFNRSKVSGLRPAGKSFKTQDQPTKVIKPGSYDVGDGVFDSATFCVNSFSQPSKVLRIPTSEERRWITTRCRKGGAQPTGYQPSLNENWSSDPPDLPYRLAMSKDSPERWWKRIFTFERDASVTLEERRRAALLERSENLERLYASSDAIPICVCGSRGREADVEENTEQEAEEDVCGGDRYSEEAIVSGADILREVVCEKMLSEDEYEGEDAEDLLMTVCCPPEGTYIVTRRRSSSGTLRAGDRSSEVGDERESGVYWEEEEGAGGGGGGGGGVRAEGEKEGRRGEEGEEEEYRAVPWDELEWEKTCGTMRDGDEFSDSTFTDMDESMTEEGDSISGIEIASGSNDLGGTDSKVQRKKRKSKKIKRKKQVRPKNPRKKLPCPPVVDKADLLQRKVGELLFSPALEAPRSPVYLVRKSCDRKLCKKLKFTKHNIRASKCGAASSSPANLPANYRGRSTRRFCTANSSDKKKICLSSKLFVTVPEQRRNHANKFAEF